jgi:hypothetical protein
MGGLNEEHKETVYRVIETIIAIFGLVVGVWLLLD